MGEIAPAAPSAAPARAVTPGGRSVFAVMALATMALLLARNQRAFTAAVHERGDFAANSILVTDAKHLDLLVGNYSRLGFSHPGPAFLYVQAFGEWLLFDLLHAVPAPWNGQWVALLALNAVLVGLTLAVVHSWSASWPATALCGAAALLFLAVQPPLLASAWMPHLYVAPFLLLLVAGGSVAAGRFTHLPALALAGGLLVHGHAGFLFFVPPMVGAALLAGWRSRAGTPATRYAAGGVSALFALPIALNLTTRWPGDFGRYFGYGGRRGLHPPGDVAGYLLRFWAERTPLAAVLVVVLCGGVALLARRDPFLTAGLLMAAVGIVLFAAYATRGIDDLGQTYVGHFSRAIPLSLLMLAVLGLTRARRGPAPVLALAVVVGALGVASRAPAFTSNPEHLPELPRAVAALRGYTGGRPAVVDLEHAAWPALTALITHGDRHGQRVCARDPQWRFLVTAAHVCGGRDLAAGRPVHLGTAPDGAVLARVDGMLLSTPGP